MNTPHETTRRTFLGSALASAAGAAMGPALLSQPVFADEPRAKIKLLILGGTKFLGPPTVETALARGHTVTLFNRGRTNPGMFPDVEKLKGDRNDDLEALEGREWDAVIDTHAMDPAWVHKSAGLLADKVKHYTFVSTVSVYPEFGQTEEPVDEDSELARLPEGTPETPFQMRYYGPFKVLCEEAAEKAMPGRVANVRPGLIVGPRDGSHRFTYWPMRIHRGGEILAPDDKKSRIQFVDVRDLGAWLVHIAEKRITGAYNAVGFKETVGWETFLEAARKAINPEARFVWPTKAFLEAQRVRPWMDLPNYMGSMGWIKNERAVAKGLTFRPLAETARDTRDWALEAFKDKPLTFGVRDKTQAEALSAAGRTPTRWGLSEEREAKVLEAWHEQQKAK